MIYVAKSLGMKTALGCMVSSSISVTASTHLSPLIDYADLDGNLLVANDPYRGVTEQKGQLVLLAGAACPARNSVRAAPAISSRPTPPAPTGQPQNLLCSSFPSVASSDDDSACRTQSPADQHHRLRSVRFPHC